MEVAGLRAEEEKRDDGALEDLEVSGDKEGGCMRRAQQAVDRAERQHHQQQQRRSLGWGGLA